MGILVKVTDKIPLNLQLGDRDTAKYVKAFLFDKLGAPLATPSVGLTHLSDGLYLDTSVEMPDVPSVIAQYIVFEDAGFTIEHEEHEAVVDMFERDEIADATSALIEASRKADLEATVLDEDRLTAVVQDKDALLATVEDANELAAAISDPDEMEATIKDEDALVGEID